MTERFLDSKVILPFSSLVFMAIAACSSGENKTISPSEIPLLTATNTFVPESTITKEPTDHSTEIPELSKLLISGRYKISFSFPHDWDQITNAKNEELPFDWNNERVLFDNIAVFDQHGCGFYVSDTGGGHGPTEIYSENFYGSVDGMDFTRRSWYKSEELNQVDIPFFSYFFPINIEEFQQNVGNQLLLWSFTPEIGFEKCKDQIDGILTSLHFLDSTKIILE